MKQAAGAFRILVIAQCDGRAADAELADFAVLHGLAAVRREQQNALVFERHADGQRLVFGEFAVHDVVRAVAGDFRRAVEVDILHAWQILLQLVQMFDRHDFAGKEDRAKRRRRFVGQRVHRRQEAQRADRPDHQRRAAVAEEIHQLCRVGEIRRRHDFHARPREQAAVNILDGYVEVKRRLIGQHVIFRNGKRFRKAGDKLAHVAVADDHALRRAGRAAGEIDVERVGVDHLRAHDGKRVLVKRRFFQLFDEQNARGRVDVFQLSQVRPIGDDDRRIQRFEHRAHARRGMAQIQLQNRRTRHRPRP